MAISSVSASTNAIQQSQHAQASKLPEEPVRAREARVPEQKPEPAKPVVNVQGETTGKVINTSA